MTVCPKCNRDFAGVKPELAGKRIQCPCGHKLRLPKDLGSLKSKAEIPKSSPSTQNHSESESLTASKPAAVRQRRAIDFEYDDLDDILAGRGRTEADFNPAQPKANAIRPADPITSPQNQPSPVTEPQQRLKLRSPSNVRAARAQSVPNRASSRQQSTDPSHARSTTSPTTELTTAAPKVRSGLGVAASVVSSVVALLFAFCLIAPRLVADNELPFKGLSQPISQIYTGNFGHEEISRGNRIGFVGLGWSITAIGLVLLCLSIFQIGGLAIQMFTHLRLLRWIDGAIATCAVVLIFSIVGTLFLHTAHVGKLKRELNQVVSANEVVPESVVRLRSDYDQRQSGFIRFVLGTTGLAAGLFGVSVVRLWVGSK